MMMLKHEVFQKSLMNSLDNKIMKLMEEVGELSRAYLKSKNSVNSSRGLDSITPEDVLEEAIDSYLVILDIINHITKTHNIDENKIDELIKQKLEVWNKKFAK